MAKVKVQGTNVFVWDGTELTQLGCLKTIDYGSDSPTRIEDTCLEETDSKGYSYGLNDPGAGSLGFTYDDENESHLKLIEWGESRKSLTFYVGLDKSTDVPTGTSGTVTLPTSRNWHTFNANLTSGQPTLEADSFVKYSLPMQRSTGVKTVPRTT